MRQWTAGFLATIATLAAAATAEAVACPAGTGSPVTIQNATVATLLCDYNAIINGQFNSTSDTQGPVLIGGNLGPGTVALNDNGIVLGSSAGTTAITGYGEVNVFGNQTAVFNPAKGHVFVGGSVSSNIPPFPGATAPQPTGGYTFPGDGPNNAGTFATDIWGKMTTLSSNLATLSSPSTVAGSTFTGVANTDGVAVFNITLAQLNGMTGTLSFAGCLLTSNPGGACDAVINVEDAGTFNGSVSYGALTAAQQNLIWNFEAATSVDITHTEWFASILAPNATVVNTHPIEGNLIAASLGGSAPIGSGELHDFPFDCSDNLCGTMGPPIIPTPEPGSLSMLGSAFAAFAAFVVIRRRRA
jgi:choice-of-anchor A domain-containing protein